jgi:N-acetylneuraminic acid mutarotase
VWTGSELLVHGPVFAGSGEIPKGRSVAAAYNPATRSWRRLPPAPGAVLNGEGGYRAVWSGSELLGWGMGLHAAYNPTTNRWRTLAPAPIGAPSLTVWTGRQVLLWGGGCCDDFLADGAGYDPATDTWQPLPAAPLAGRHTTGAWTGRELIVVGGDGVASRQPSTYTVFADAAAYNPATRSWRRLPPMPRPRADATVTWDGREVLVVGGRGTVGRSGLYADGVAYNPATNRWRTLPAMDTSRVGHTAVWTGHQLLVWGGRTMRAGSWVAPAHGIAYDPASNRWSPLPRSPLRGRTGHLAVWTGTQMLIWGGSSVTPDPSTGNPASLVDGAAYDPDPR